MNLLKSRQIFAAAILIAASAATAHAQTRTMPNPQQRAAMAQKMQDARDAFYKTLNLTSDQRTKMDAIQAKYEKIGMSRLGELQKKFGGSVSLEQRKAYTVDALNMSMTLGDGIRKESLAILNPTQQVAYKKMDDTRRTRMIEVRDKLMKKQ